MAPSGKENNVLTATPPATGTASSTNSFRAEETASRPSPVALEVPVTVNGARTVEGSDKREPFSETTQTVLVFGNGAVIRLSSPVAAGQLLFLTNEKTKKEVVCQVVKSKNYRSVSGYVELEFTESVVGFWGMRFPTDRVVVQSPTATAVPPAPGAATVSKSNVAPSAPILPKIELPAASAAPKTPELSPVAPGQAKPPVSSPVLETASLGPTVAPAQRSVLPQPPVATTPATKVPEAAPHSPTIAATLASSVVNLLGSPEVPSTAASLKSASPQSATSEPASLIPAQTSSEELKFQTARLQEQLSSMLFEEVERKEGSVAAPTAASVTPVSLAAKVLEISESQPAPAKTAPSAKTTPAPIKSSLDSEEVKIPSWLEPLARNAATAAAPQEPAEREATKHSVEVSEREESKAEPARAPLAATPEQETPAMLGLPPVEEELVVGSHLETSGGSGRGLWIGLVAAAIVLAAGAGWYFFVRPADGTSGTAASVAHATNPQTTPTTAALPAQPAVQPTQTVTQNVPSATEVAGANDSGYKNSAPEGSVVKNASASPARPVAVPAKPTLNSEPLANARQNARGSSISAVPAASMERIPRVTETVDAPAQPEAKKPNIGEVHLASPTVNRAKPKTEDGDAPSISAADADGATVNFGTGLVEGSNVPAAPVTVGGDVKVAKLLSSVPPIYPALAKTQHIVGDVSIDALIDDNGKVTTMKVVSGPALLRQAAMDALKQWKYQPASLDGKPVAMHLTVTLQFRMQ